MRDMRVLKSPSLIMLMLIVISCSTTKKNVEENTNGREEVAELTTIKDRPLSDVHYIPHAVVYKTNGNFNDNVPIQVSADGKTLISFPAPTDLNSSSLPLVLTEGWLLDRRGVSVDTRFTSYKYSNYESLSSAPSVTDLLHSIIPNARIVEMIELPITTNEAVNDTTKVNQLIKNGFVNCKIIMSQPVFHP